MKPERQPTENPSTFKTEVLKERGKKRPPSTRASRRAKTMALVKQVTDLIADLGPHQKKAIQVLIDQLKATRKVYHNGICVDEVPDQVIRQKAAIAILEWLHGKPREFQMQVTGGYDDLGEMLERLRDSDEWKRLNSQQKTVQGHEIPPALPNAAREEGEQAG